MTTENVPETPKASEPVKVETPKERIFVYDGREFSDPDHKLSPDEIRQYYVSFFPELANAEVLKPVERTSKAPGGAPQQVIEFKRRVGVKG